MWNINVIFKGDKSETVLVRNEMDRSLGRHLRWSLSQARPRIDVQTKMNVSPFVIFFGNQGIACIRDAGHWGQRGRGVTKESRMPPTWSNEKVENKCKYTKPHGCLQQLLHRARAGPQHILLLMPLNRFVRREPTFLLLRRHLKSLTRSYLELHSHV